MQGALMLHMTRLVALAMLMVMATTAGSVAQTPPPFNMKGTWKGVGEAIMDGAPPLHPQDAPGGRPAGPYRLREANWTYKIDGQDGRRFWGTVSSDVASNERLIGSLSRDGKWIYMAGKAGILDGTIVDQDTIEMCYRHANAASALVNCNEMKRVK
jgi:hypothetical protein